MGMVKDPESAEEIEIARFSCFEYSVNLVPLNAALRLATKRYLKLYERA